MVIVSGLLLMVAPLLYCPKYFSTIRGMVTVQKAYKFRIYPDAAQRKQLAVEFGNNRFVFLVAFDLYW